MWGRGRVAAGGERRTVDMTPSGLSRSRARQAAALSAADQQATANDRTTRTKLAAALDMSYATYMRYVTAETPLRFDQVALFAQAYGIPEDVLGHAILTGDVRQLEAEPYDMAADLRSHIPEDDIPDFVAKYAGLDAQSQRSAADGAKRMANRVRDATKRSNHGA